MKENEEKTVLIPIKLIDHDICLTCPDLEIENYQQVIYHDGIKEVYENRLQCSHYKRCRHLAERLSTHEKHSL